MGLPGGKKGRGRDKARKAGPSYGMVGFAGSRQPPGPAPEAMAKLRAEGILLTDGDWQPELDVEPAPTQHDATSAGTSGSGSTTMEASIRSAPHPNASPTVDKAEPRPRPTKKRSPRKRRGGNGYTLPPAAPQRKTTRSCHFRLPREIEGYLEELAKAHACTRTHVICSAIQSEWERMGRARGRKSEQKSASEARNAE